MGALEVARRVAALAEDKKGIDPVILDLRPLSVVSDFFVVVSGSSSTHTLALADHIERELFSLGHKLHGKESDEQGQWILLDFLSVVVHVFLQSTRDFYNLERLWGEAKHVPL